MTKASSPLVISPLTELELEAASFFARSNFEASLAIFFNEEGVEQFHDSVSDLEISERMQQVSQFYIAKKKKNIVGFIELYRRRHIALMLVEKEETNLQTVTELISFLKEIIEQKERDHYLTIHAAPTGYPLFKEIGFKVTGEEQVYAGGISSLMTLRW